MKDSDTVELSCNGCGDPVNVAYGSIAIGGTEVYCNECGGGW